MNPYLLTRLFQEENRRKALEKIRQRSGGTPPVTQSSSRSNNKVTKPSTGKFNLSEDQRRKIEANRAKALEKLKEKQQNFRNASTNQNSSLQKPNTSTNGIKSTIRASTYIDYDMSKMKDNKGGFISMDSHNGAPGQEGEKTFDQWQSEQRIVRDLPPPIDMENATKCYECGTFEIDQQLWDVFECRVCKRCAKKTPEKYALLTKTECKEDYYLTEPELQDLTLLKRLEKPNPYGTFSRMQLFIRYQVEEFAFKKWGSSDALDDEWKRREEFRIRRREKRYQDQLKEIRKKTRAEEFNRRIREGRFDDHTHQFSAQAFDAGENEDGLKQVKRRCISCGFETVELSM
ncbi:hypothetical protein WICPIJ_002190 [Wickerhamomyces pijperi]|uniref:XPA C-terminal domain-containing protein n=1 Tax=Wickerhamomyces pijperi TaxID=599730 RepID=A0A9P8TP64_WICPI|nr:hypothetical protein WICPIJ_002190 [Wickerhamomyces pijperi]